MGVTGLWRLIEPSGKPVPLETLENKVLAVDVSIWLHQAIKGFQDSQGGPLPNAHLLGIYHRVCKLLYFRIKPIFVFDGGVPNLKKETISKRYQQKSKNLTEAERIQKQLLATLLKHSAVNKVLSETTKATLTENKPNLQKLINKQKSEDIYKLPPTDFDSTLSSDDETSESTTDSSPTKHWDLHTIDEQSPHFKSLPADVRHDILTELKETRKQSSWGRIHELPKKSDDFSGYQMKRLLKRYSVQVSLEEAEKEMGGRTLSLAELETLLKDQGVVTSSSNLGRRIASDENTRYLLIKDTKKAMDEASKRKSALESIQEEGDESKSAEDEKKESPESEVQTNGHSTDSEFQRDLEKAIQLSLQDVPSTSQGDGDGKPKKAKKHNFSFLDNFDDADFQSTSESEEEAPHPKEINKILASAKSYMMEYSGLTPSEIAKIIGGNAGSRGKSKINTGSKSHSPENTRSDVSPILVASNKIESSVSLEEDIQTDEKQIVEGESASEDKEDGRVSSSTTKTSEVKIVPPETNEVSSTDKAESTSNSLKHYETVPSSTTETIECASETVEIMSDTSSDSDDLVIVSEVSNKTKESKSSLKIDGEVLPSTTKIIECDSEIVEVMSNDGSDSDDLVDVSEVSNKTKQAGRFEILIKPEDPLEDDLFSDIFCDPKKENSITDSTKPSASTIPTAEIKSAVTIETVEQVSSSDCNMPTRSIDEPTEMENNADSTEKEPTTEEISVKPKTEESEKPKAAEEQKKNIIAEFVKPKTAEDSKFRKEIGQQILTAEQLKEIEANLQQEEAELVSERLSKERMASNLTDQIYQEAQELLQLFGVPYIVAPMEAEAQCAFLDDIDLTDGTITDDSDIWLFGGRTVYKNFFNQHKLVMEYRAENILHHFKLSREQMVLLALLVGSDYTVGIQGIGPVTALEVLAAFPPSRNADQQLISGLKEFRRWLLGERAVGPGRTTLRNKLKNVSLTDSFPSVQVVQAYLEPTVDSSREPFSWAKPDMEGLIAFARKKFGWPQHKSEEILKPVFKSLNENRIQRSIKDYFQTKRKIDGGEAQSKMSKRVKQAINRIEKGDAASDEEKKVKKVRKKPAQKGRKAKKGKPDTTESKDVDETTAENVETATKTEDVVDTTAKTEDVADTAAKSEDVAETAGFSSDEDIQILKKTRIASTKKLQQIRTEVKNEIEQQQAKKPRPTASFHKKDVIPQKEQARVDALRSKMKAIEVFRKSKKGPGYVPKKKNVVRQPKDDAELSESSSD